MRSLLTNTGRIFLDVNNRYNARAYGWMLTIRRILYDLVHPSEANGDVEFTWRIGEQVVRASGHVFTLREVENLVRDAGLRVHRRFIIDYRTGQLRRSVFGGQLLYELEGR